MAYNGSGLFQILNSFSPATTILSSAVNANNSDIATGLSKVLTRDNEAPMTAALRLDDGSEALPGLAFDDDTNTGLRRSDDDELQIVTGGTDRVMVDANGKVWALFDVDVAGAVNLQSTLAVTGLITATAGVDIGASDTTLTRTGAGDIAVEGNGVYRAGGTDVAIADGGTGAGTAADAFTALKQAASDSATGVIEIAVQSEMETPSSTALAVTPGRQHFHPGHPKAWGAVASNGTLGSNYNVASAVKDSTGVYTVTLTTACSSSTYAVVGSGGSNSGTRSFSALPSSASVFVVNINDHNAALVDSAFNFTVFGDQS